MHLLAYYGSDQAPANQIVGYLVRTPWPAKQAGKMITLPSGKDRVQIDILG